MVQEEKEDFLIVLGETLKKELTEKVDKEAHLVITDLFDYYNNLDDVLLLIKSKNINEQRKGLTLFKKIAKQGGPQHLYVDIDFDDIKEFYSIKRKQLLNMKSIMNDTRDLWERIELISESKLRRH